MNDQKPTEGTYYVIRRWYFWLLMLIAGMSGVVVGMSILIVSVSWGTT